MKGHIRLRFFAVVGTLVGVCAAAECFSSGVREGGQWDFGYRVVEAGMRFSWMLVAGVVLGVVSEGGLWALREARGKMGGFLEGVWRLEGWRWIEVGEGGD